MMVPGWRVFGIAALLMILVSLILWGLDIIPWWGMLLAVPVGTVILVMTGFILFVGAWMANGSH